MKLMRSLWNDESGFVVSAELVMIATIAVMGLLVGLASVRDGVTSELSDVAGAVQDANQSYSVDGVVGHSSNTAGFDYLDEVDWCDSPDHDNTGLPPEIVDNCITIDGDIVAEGGFAADVN